MKLYTYVNYKGRCQEAFRFYERHLGGKVTMMMTFGDGPKEVAAPPAWKDKVLHARMTIGETELMGADIPDAEPMRSAYLTLLAGSNEEAERVFAALSTGGEVLMALTETFFAHRFGQLRDPFGMNWMILHERPMQNA